MESGLADFKERARKTWAAGRFDEIAKTILGVGQTVADAAAIEPGMRVLDVACGTGNATVPAALAGGKTTGVDLTPELFDDARRNAAEAGVEIDWMQGDAEDLPFDDGSFDRVLSVFGAMFAPRHEVTASELARVCAPGGTIVLASWTPDGLIGRMFKLSASRMPPPPPFASPPILWGNPGHALDLLGSHGLEVRSQEMEATFNAETVEEVVHRMEEFFGPWVMLRAAVGEEAWPALRAEFVELYESGNRAPVGEPAEVRAEYLLTIARKPL